MRLVHGQLGWMLAVALVLAIFGSLSYTLFFVFTLIGLLIVSALTAPVSVSPTWHQRLRWLILFCLVGFGVIVYHRIVEILPREVLSL